MSKNVFKIALDHMVVIFGTGGAKAIAFATTVVLARALGAENFGHYSLFNATMIIAWYIPQAFDTAFIRFAKVADTNEIVVDSLRSATMMKCCFALLVTILAYPTALAINAGGTEDKIGYYVGSGMVCGSMLSFISSLSNLFVLREQFGRYSIVQGAYNLAVFFVVCLVVYILKSKNLHSIIIAYLIVASIFAVISFRLVYKMSGNPLKATRNANKIMFKFVKWVFLVTVAFYIASRIDILALSYFAPYKEVGIYSAACQITLFITLLHSSMSTVFMPRAMKAVESTPYLTEYFKEAAIPITIVLFGIIMLYIFAPLCFMILFPAEFAPAAHILRILLIGYIFQSFYIPVSFLFYAVDKPNIRCALEFFKLFVMATLLLIFTPSKGMVGAAQAISSAMALNCILSTAVFIIFSVKRIPKEKIK